jgi:hypothetical protein
VGVSVPVPVAVSDSVAEAVRLLVALVLSEAETLAVDVSEAVCMPETETRVRRGVDEVVRGKRPTPLSAKVVLARPAARVVSGRREGQADPGASSRCRSLS